MGVQLGLLDDGVVRVVTPREHPPEEGSARAAAPAVLGAVAPHRTSSPLIAPHRTEVLADPVAGCDEREGSGQHHNDALHDSTSDSWAVGDGRWAG